MSFVDPNDVTPPSLLSPEEAAVWLQDRVGRHVLQAGLISTEHSMAAMRRAEQLLGGRAMEQHLAARRGRNQDGSPFGLRDRGPVVSGVPFPPPDPSMVPEPGGRGPTTVLGRMGLLPPGPTAFPGGSLPGAPQPGGGDGPATGQPVTPVVRRGTHDQHRAAPSPDGASPPRPVVLGRRVTRARLPRTDPPTGNRPPPSEALLTDVARGAPQLLAPRPRPGDPTAPQPVPDGTRPGARPPRAGRRLNPLGGEPLDGPPIPPVIAPSPVRPEPETGQAPGGTGTGRGLRPVDRPPTPEPGPTVDDGPGRPLPPSAEAPGPSARILPHPLARGQRFQAEAVVRPVRRRPGLEGLFDPPPPPRDGGRDPVAEQTAPPPSPLLLAPPPPRPDGPLPASPRRAQAPAAVVDDDSDEDDVVIVPDEALVAPGPAVGPAGGGAEGGDAPAARAALDEADLALIVERVQRQLARRLEVERERREGTIRWL